MRRTVCIVLLALVGTAGFWLADVAVILQVNGIDRADNGFFNVDAQKLQHVGMYISVGTLWLVAVLGITGDR